MYFLFCVPTENSDHELYGRYCNMDYVFLSSIMGVALVLIIASYDIACQFFPGLSQRLPHLPERLRRTFSIERIVPKVPKAHIYTHVESCHGPFSFNWTKGAGRTDGEGIERLWSLLNRASLSVREMAPSARRETIDDLCGFINWSKLIGYGKK